MKKINSVFLFITVIGIIAIYIIYNIYIRQDIRRKEEIIKIKEKQTSTDLRIGIANFDSINPLISKSKEVQNISRLIFEPLINLTYDYKLEPCLAKEWSKIDNKVYLIKLKEDVRWHDGTYFNADDVIYTVKIIKKLKDNSLYYKNVEDILEIKKIDELTIKIINNNETPYFEYDLIFPIISSKYYTQENLFEGADVANIVGTGMYYISDTNKENIILKNNSIWWKNIRRNISDIYIKLYKNINDEIKDIEIKKIDLFTTSEVDINIDKYKNNEKKYIIKKYDYKFNSTELLFTEEKISKYSKDNELIVNMEEELKKIMKRIEENYNKDDTYINSNFDKNIIIYSRNLKGEITPNLYNVFYNIENWYREYDK